MKAMVLAAGRGERLRPWTNLLPKPMIPVDGKPLIHYTLSYLKNCGVDEVIINLHHLGQKIQSYVGNGNEWGLRIKYSWEKQLLGTGGGLQKAAAYLVGEPFVVMNADILVELDLRDVVRFHEENQAVVTMVLRRDRDVDRYGAIEIDAYGWVREFLGRLAGPKGPWRRLMFTGVQVVDPVVFTYMNSEKACFSIIEIYLDMIRAGERVLGYEMKGFWTDLGTEDRYDRFLRMLGEGAVTMDRFVRGCVNGG